MFHSSVYVARREKLMSDVGSGLIVLAGNAEAPKNYTDNTYAFRQDSSFLYFLGLDHPDLVAVLDADERRVTVYGDDYTVDQIVWMGPQPSIADRAATSGVTDTAPRAALDERLGQAIRQGRRVHFLPQYRHGEPDPGSSGCSASAPSGSTSTRRSPLIKAVVAQRAVKSAEELREIELAIGRRTKCRCWR